MTQQNTETLTRQQLEAELATLATQDTNALTREQLAHLNELLSALDELNAED